MILKFLRWLFALPSLPLCQPPRREQGEPESLRVWLPPAGPFPWPVPDVKFFDGRKWRPGTVICRVEDTFTTPAVWWYRIDETTGDGQAYTGRKFSVAPRLVLNSRDWRRLYGNTE